MRALISKAFASSSSLLRGASSSFFFFGGPAFSYFMLISSVNLALMTANVRFSKKKAPIKMIG
jgi:hypothetical protein